MSLISFSSVSLTDNSYARTLLGSFSSRVTTSICRLSHSRRRERQNWPAYSPISSIATSSRYFMSSYPFMCRRSFGICSMYHFLSRSRRSMVSGLISRLCQPSRRLRASNEALMRCLSKKAICSGSSSIFVFVQNFFLRQCFGLHRLQLRIQIKRHFGMVVFIRIRQHRPLRRSARISALF